MFETLNARFRRVLVSLIAAVFVAAVLRHVLHVYGWIPREDIRIGALIALLLARIVLCSCFGNQVEALSGAAPFNTQAFRA
jgi:uncharacterized membrane protein required for colicin V production